MSTSSVAEYVETTKACERSLQLPSKDRWFAWWIWTVVVKAYMCPPLRRPLVTSQSYWRRKSNIPSNLEYQRNIKFEIVRSHWYLTMEKLTSTCLFSYFLGMKLFRIVKQRPHDLFVVLKAWMCPPIRCSLVTSKSFLILRCHPWAPEEHNLWTF